MVFPTMPGPDPAGALDPTSHGTPLALGRFLLSPCPSREEAYFSQD